MTNRRQRPSPLRGCPKHRQPRRGPLGPTAARPAALNGSPLWPGPHPLHSRRCYAPLIRRPTNSTWGTSHRFKAERQSRASPLNGDHRLKGYGKKSVTAMAVGPELELGAVATEPLQLLRQQALAPMGMPVEQGVNLGLILPRVNCAGGIEGAPPVRRPDPARTNAPCCSQAVGPWPPPSGKAADLAVPWQWAAEVGPPPPRRPAPGPPWQGRPRWSDVPIRRP